MRLATFFLPQSIALPGSLLAAPFLLTPGPATLAPAALFPANCSDRRPRDRIRRCLQSPGRAQSPLAKPECPRNPTRLSAPEEWLFHQLRPPPPRPRSIPCVAPPSQPQENTRRARRGFPSISTGTARSAGSEHAPKKTNTYD